MKKYVSIGLICLFIGGPSGVALLWGANAQATLSQESVLSLQASKLAVAGEYQQAIGVYNRLVRLDPNDADHYIQRGLMYRQIKQHQSGASDGKTALALADYYLQKNPSRKRQAKYLWQRAMAHRLMDNYDQAKRDMRQAMRLTGSQRWLPDLQAIELESRIYGSGR